MTDPRINTIEKADRYAFLMDALREIGVTCVFTKGGKEEFKSVLKQFENNKIRVTKLLEQIERFEAKKSYEEMRGDDYDDSTITTLKLLKSIMDVVQ